MRFITTILLLVFSLSFGKALKMEENYTATHYGSQYMTVRYTANGERFDKNAMTCAAPSHFKFGTILRVTNKANGKSVDVRVNDRGAFGNRNIDLTYGAFAKIAEHRTGRIQVSVTKIK